MAKKIKLDDFIKIAEDDLSWRKKEITDLLLSNNGNNDFLIAKSVILLLYSHWEGYIKNITKSYIYHVSNENIKLNDLTHNFEAISLKNELNIARDLSEKIRIDCDVTIIKNIYERLDDTFSIPEEILNEKNKKFINTHDNLNYRTLSFILNIVGIESLTVISNRDKYIDNTLLNQRNTISHGTKIELSNPGFNLDIDKVKELKNFIFIVLDHIKDELIHYSEEKLYLYKNNKILKDRVTIRKKELQQELVAVFSE